jgi:hypothetical protein
MCSILIGYALMAEGTSRQVILFLIPVFGGYLVASFLGFGATGEFKITYLATGPTEIRIWFIVLNTALTIFGTTWILPLLSWILVVSIVFLCIMSFRTQKYLWKLDMDIKRQQEQNKGVSP